MEGGGEVPSLKAGPPHSLCGWGQVQKDQAEAHPLTGCVLGQVYDPLCALAFSSRKRHVNCPNRPSSKVPYYLLPVVAPNNAGRKAQTLPGDPLPLCCKENWTFPLIPGVGGGAKGDSDHNKSTCTNSHVGSPNPQPNYQL